MHTIYLYTTIGAITAATLFAVLYIVGFALAAGSWSFHRMIRQIKSIRTERQSGAFVCTTHLCSVPCPRPDATCSWSSDQKDVDAVRLFQGENNATGHDTP